MKKFWGAVHARGFLALAGLVLGLAPAAFAQSATEIARNHVQSNFQQFGLTGSDVNEIEVSAEVLSRHNGVTHVYLVQKHRGISVHNGILNVNVASNGSVISAGNRSDWFALTLTSHPGDTAVTPRGIGNYLVYEAAGDRGIRPTQYTTDMAVNPSTYASVADVANISQPHGIGYVWNTMLWEVYWNLVDAYGYNPNIYDHWTTAGNNLAFQLVMDGMKFQPCRPGFVDGRNAILAADMALTCGAWNRHLAGGSSIPKSAAPPHHHFLRTTARQDSLEGCFTHSKNAEILGNADDQAG